VKVAVLGPGAGPGTLGACLEAGANLLIPWGATLEQFVAATATLAGVRNASLPNPPPKAEEPRSRAARELLDTLTSRERAVLADMVAGRRAAAIARASYVSLHTVRSQIRSILDKLDVHSQLEAVAVARRAGWP
jgi:DNA-binding NarL/FixJ family response regulator